MKTCGALWVGLVAWAGLTSRLVAQVPATATPGVPAAPTTTAAPTTAAPTTSSPTTLWSFLGISQQNCQKCKTCLCQSTAGQLLNSMTAPFTLATGGLVPPLCPPTIPNLANLENVSPEEGAAAAIKADEAGAKARRAAVRYLGTVDCHYYPEAEKALISALRSDRNECVRWEAAMSLSRGCCCNKNTIAALTLVVTGEEKDKNPAETSGRVKAAAAYALQICLCRYQGHITAPQAPPEPPPEPEPPPAKERDTGAASGHGGIVLSAYYTRQVPRESMAQLVQEAGRALAATVGSPQEPRFIPAGQRSVLGILQNTTASTRAQDEVRYEEAALGLSAGRGRPRVSVTFQGEAPAPVAAAAVWRPASRPGFFASAPQVRPASGLVPQNPDATKGVANSAPAPVVAPPAFPVGGMSVSPAVTPPTFPVGTSGPPALPDRLPDHGPLLDSPR
jgi:hypothetical protein